jgi:hypothetical protein
VFQDYSASEAVTAYVRRERPQMIFIDGDHSTEGALRDHMLARSTAKIIVHHNVASTACPGTTLLWPALKEFERGTFEIAEFTGQYASVGKPYLGIGVLHRKN